MATALRNSSRAHNIEVVIFHEGREFIFHTYAGEYRSLMALIYDKIYIDNFGDCKGIGRCGTCHVHLLDYIGELLKREGNEETTLMHLSAQRRHTLHRPRLRFPADGQAHIPPTS